MKIIADTNIPLAREAFSSLGEVALIPGREINKKVVEDAEILLVRSVTRVDKALLEDTKVKFVATATIGEDHIDKAYLTAKGIGFSSAPGSNADSVAEYVITALHHLSVKYRFILEGLTMGIIGVGNVGSRVLKRSEILGINCLLNDPPLQRCTGDARYLPLSDVLKNSDIITVHVPLTKDGNDATYKLINHDFLVQLKPGAVLFNTSRGKIMEEKAILARRNQLTALVLDVWENEPEVPLDILSAADIATPHIAGYSYDGKIRGTMMIYQAVCRHFALQDEWGKIIGNQKEEIKTIDLTSSNSPLFDALKTAYPIMQDDENLRKITSMESEQRAAYFDELRKNYPIRREFDKYKLILNPHQPEKIGQILAALSFKVVYK